MGETLAHIHSPQHRSLDSWYPVWGGIVAVVGIAIATQVAPHSDQPVFNSVAQFFSTHGNTLFLVVGYLGLVVQQVRARAWARLKAILATLLVVTLVVQAEKLVFGEWLIRPSGALGGFPSGHAAAACALALLIALFAPKWSLLGYSMAIGISWSRVPVAAHWPYQVVVGAVTGTLLALLLTDRLAPRARHHAIAALGRSLLVFSVPLAALWYGGYEYENGPVVFISAAVLGAAGMAVRIWCLRGQRTLPAGDPPAAIWRRRQYLANTLICAGVTLGAEIIWLVPLAVLMCFTIYTLAERAHQAVPSSPSIPRWSLLRHAWVREAAWILLIVPVVLKELLY